MNHGILDDLYDATEEDLLYGIGLLALPDREPAPYVHIHYRDWSRRKLEVVRASLRGGLDFTVTDPVNGFCDAHIGTRERVGIQAERGGHTSLLRAPAWDARLTRIDEQVTRRFEADSRRCGGFLLLVQTPEWEFLVTMASERSATSLGPVRTRSFPAPLGAAR